MLIHTKDLTKVYRIGDNVIRALAGVSVDIAQGEMTAVMGPSGSGKSTFMNVIGCLDLPSAGEYRLELDCVSSHVTWFALVGSRPASLNVEVVGGAS